MLGIKGEFFQGHAQNKVTSKTTCMWQGKKVGGLWDAGEENAKKRDRKGERAKQPSVSLQILQGLGSQSMDMVDMVLTQGK